MNGLILAAALALTASAADAPVLPDMAVGHSTPGWSKQGRSLVLYDAEGALAFEIGLLREENGAVTREVLGDASPDGKAAWTLERTLTWNPSRGKLLESRRLLKIHGSQGQTLWRDESADWPEKGDPVVFSNDSKVVLIARHFGESWSVEARDWAGGTKLMAGPFPRLVSIALTPGGRYAVARWGVPDKSDTHSFFDLWTKARKDIETSDLTLGLARIGDDGVVWSGRRSVFAFSTAASTSTATDGARK
ncbi:MAG: hypothetical protein PHS14_00790 [Elusimicrobia bacterium]|nr:hypothetical protein [Elusimicrobiota bacterium]